LVVQKGQGSIAFEDVVFHYGKDKGVMERFSLSIPAGQKVGIVGRSGAGKSTLVNLVLRFYDVADGAVKIDGHNIAGVTQDSLRRHIGVVRQENELFHRSIRENIAYARPEATDAEVMVAARKAHADGFIAALGDKYGNQGYDALVGERGVKLSGGQRQRVAIARVILEDAPIFVFDEATSALDSEAEEAIQENLATLMEGKTVVAIAHRLSTLQIMDRIVVMDKGAVVEDGNHAQLLKLKDGIYASLWKKQSGGFIHDED
jgi:ATP-binding cassette subfamily B multidrug efflux pump